MITVKTKVKALMKTVWDSWSKPEHITKWNNASDDWHTPYAENDLRTGGKFKSTMAAKNGSMSFDFEGEYSLVEPNKTIKYSLPDGRKVEIYFTETSEGIDIIEKFDPENENPEALQQQGWQAILDNFKKYTENLNIL